MILTLKDSSLTRFGLNYHLVLFCRNNDFLYFQFICFLYYLSIIFIILLLSIYCGCYLFTALGARQHSIGPSIAFTIPQR